MMFGLFDDEGVCEHNGVGLIQTSKISAKQDDIFLWGNVISQGIRKLNVFVHGKTRPYHCVRGLTQDLW